MGIIAIGWFCSLVAFSCGLAIVGHFDYAVAFLVANSITGIIVKFLLHNKKDHEREEARFIALKERDSIVSQLSALGLSLTNTKNTLDELANRSESGRLLPQFEEAQRLYDQAVKDFDWMDPFPKGVSEFMLLSVDQYEDHSHNFNFVLDQLKSAQELSKSVSHSANSLMGRKKRLPKWLGLSDGMIKSDLGKMAPFEPNSRQLLLKADMAIRQARKALYEENDPDKAEILISKADDLDRRARSYYRAMRDKKMRQTF